MAIYYTVKFFIIRVITTLIPHRHSRKKTRNFLQELSIKSIIAYFKERHIQPRPNSVLIFEPNQSHGECIPGYIKYFLDIGLNIDVLLNEKIWQEQPFCRINNDSVAFYKSSVPMMTCWLRSKNLEQYRLILVATSAPYWYQRTNQSTLDWFSLGGRKNLAVVEHDLADVENFRETDLINRGRLLTLGNFKTGKMVNPHYFGDIKVSPKNTLTRFIVVGSISNSRKGHSLLVPAVEKLLANGISNFEITVVGRGRIRDLPKRVRSFINPRGRLKFPDVYNEMERADFYLPLLDPDNKTHERYITRGISGSVQLIYGFKKPCIIHEKFAGIYGFTNDNSMIYDRDLHVMMERAIKMTEKEYENMVMELNKLVSRKYDDSLQTIKQLLLP